MMKKILIIGLITSLFLLCGCNSGYWEEKQTNECVKEKWIKRSGGSSQKYLISMESGQVYQITDSLFKGQFRSSDIYASIDEGLCYSITYFGWRNGFFSVYKTIYEVESTKG